MTLHVVGVYLLICATPWAIGLATLGAVRYLDRQPDHQPEILEVTDDRGATQHVTECS